MTVQGFVENQCETHHIERSVLHGKPDSVQTKMEALNTEECENLILRWKWEWYTCKE